jgi:ketosteroid isomerase-like protein
MSSGNRELMRRHLEHFAAGRTEAWLDDFAEDAVLYTREDEPDFGAFRGRDEIARMLALWLEQFNEMSWEPGEVELLEEGAWVIAEGRLRGLGRVSGMTVDARYAFANRFEDRKIVEAREYLTRDQALAAVRALDIERRRAD